MEDLVQLASTYETLLSKRFKYVFESGVSFHFQFQTHNFYHLLGFHKLSDSTIAQMLLNNVLDKDDFFKYVKEGKIGWDYIDNDVINGFTDHITTFNGTQYSDRLDQIKNSRIQYFTEYFLKALLLSKISIDFNPECCDSDILADKLFFKLVTEEDKYLNLFIGKNEEQNYFYPATFFLEIRKNRYYQETNSNEQKQLKLLSREIVDLRNNNLLDFYVCWINVFRDVASSIEQEILRKMKPWCGTYISEQDVRKAVFDLNQTIPYIESQKRTLDKIVPSSQEEARNIKKQIKSLAKDIKDGKRKLDAFQHYLQIVDGLELKALKKVYQAHCSTKLDENKLSTMLKKYDFFYTTISPNQFLEIYNQP